MTAYLSCKACRWLHQLYVNGDANFRQRNKETRKGKAQAPVFDGKAYYVNRASLKQHLLKGVGEVELSTCSAFWTIALANLKSAKGMVSTGCGAIACSRHEVFRPYSWVDLQKGEA